MKRAPVHLRKTALAPSERARLPASVFVFPKERRFPIHDLFHGRLALIYVMSPSLSADREKVVKAVLARYPELRSFWESRTKAQRRPQRRMRDVAARPARRTLPPAPARRRERRLSTNPSSEDNMPIYVVNPMHATRSNPLAYDATPVIVVGKPQRRLIRARTPGKPGHFSKEARISASETHALNPKTGAAFCGAGISRKTGKAAAGMIHPTNKNVVTCMRCIKVINLNDVDMSVPGVSRRRAIIERDLKPGGAKKREKHQMIRGGEQGRFVSGNAAHTSSRKAYRIYKERTAETGGPLYRGSEGIADFEKYVGWRGRPTQTIGEKRGRILEAQRTASERRRREAAEAAYAESGMAERIGAMGEFAPVEFEEREVLFEAGRRRAASAAGRRAAAERREAASAEREAAVARGRRAVGESGEYMDNPSRGRRGGKRAQAAGLKKGQSLMAKAAAAYRAGKYPTMQSALRGVARKRNPLSEDGVVVSNPRRAMGRKVDVVPEDDHPDLCGVYVNYPSKAAAAKAAAKYAGLTRWDVVGTGISAYLPVSRAAAMNIADTISMEEGIPVRVHKDVRKPGRRNPLSENGMVVSNPSLRKTKKKASKSRKTKMTATQRNRMLEEMRGRLRARRAQQRAHTSYAAEEYMDNPKRGSKGKKRGSDATDLFVVERGDGFHVLALFSNATAAMDAETHLFMHTDWVRSGNEIESEHPMTEAKAKALAKGVAQDLGVPASSIRTHKAKRQRQISKAQNAASRAMSLFRSGKADSLAEAWAMVKRA